MKIGGKAEFQSSASTDSFKLWLIKNEFEKNIGVRFLFKGPLPITKKNCKFKHHQLLQNVTWKLYQLNQAIWFFILIRPMHRLFLNNLWVDRNHFTLNIHRSNRISLTISCQKIGAISSKSTPNFEFRAIYLSLEIWNNGSRLDNKQQTKRVWVLNNHKKTKQIKTECPVHVTPMFTLTFAVQLSSEKTLCLETQWDTQRDQNILYFLFYHRNMKQKIKFALSLNVL